MRSAYIPTVAELQAFEATARLRSATTASQELNLTQGAISRSLKTLEERLGVQLFVRANQRLTLSEAGRSFQRDAERLLAELNQAALTVMSFGGNTGVMRLAVLPSFASAWLIPRLAGFHQTTPNVTFDIASRLGTVNFDVDPFDVAIQRTVHAHPSAESTVLLPERLVVVAAPSVMKSSGFLDDDALAELPLLQQATRPSLWLEWFRNAGLDSREILRGARFEHFDMVINGAIAGLGVALVPEILVSRELELGRLRLASSRRMIATHPYALIYPAKSQDLAGFGPFRDWLVAECEAYTTAQDIQGA